MKHINIECPQGYEIDKEKSTFEKIVFKEINQLPKKWEELETVTGWYVLPSSVTNDTYLSKCNVYTRNVFVTEEQAEASIALAQLSQLREVYRQGWTPDWTTLEDKYVICIDDRNDIYIDYVCSSRAFLAFQDGETAELFIENFKDLINQAAPLLF